MLLKEWRFNSDDLKHLDTIYTDRDIIYLILHISCIESVFHQNIKDFPKEINECLSL